MNLRIDRAQRRASKKPGLLTLAGGLPATELFPRRELVEGFVDVLSQPRCPGLQYGWPEGNEWLRSWIAARLTERGANVNADEIIVTNGAQQALAIATDLLDDGNAKVAVDPETYPGMLDVLRARDAEAIDPNSEADATYVMPGASNPHGRGLSEERRAELLASGKPIIADEAYAELRFDGRIERPLLADARDRVFHVGTFSKTLCPGLRVGWLVVPPSLRERARTNKHDADLEAGTLAQAVVESYLRLASFNHVLERARSLYSTRMARLLDALKRELPSFAFIEPDGGFSVWVETGIENVDETRAIEVAASHGVSFDPGSLFRASGASTPLAMRLSCSSLAGADIDDAVRRLARALRSFS